MVPGCPIVLVPKSGALLDAFEGFGETQHIAWLVKPFWHIAVEHRVYVGLRKSFDGIHVISVKVLVGNDSTQEAKANARQCRCKYLVVIITLDLGESFRDISGLDARY